MSDRYKHTPIKEFYRDLWSPIFIGENQNDYAYEIESEFDERPDLLSYELYGSPDLWWVFALRNMDELVDPIGDFKSGLVIMIPAKNSLEDLFSG